MSLISKQYQKAIDIYENLIKINSQNKEAWNNLGLFFFNLKEYQKAIECYKNALKKNSPNVEVLYKIGIAYLELKKYQNAILYFEKVVEIHPNIKKAWHNMISAYIRLKDYKKANKSSKILKSLEINLKSSIKDILKKMLKSEPGIKKILFTDRLGNVISQISNNNIQPAKNIYEIGANGSAIFCLTEELGRIEKLGVFNLQISEFHRGKIYISQYGDNSIIIFTDNDVCIGLIRLILKRVESDLNNIINEFLRN
ncbi:MAG: tetratricopeptide repeat protein [Promethearchaeota archaeon]